MRFLFALVFTLGLALVTSTSPKQQTRQPLRGHHFTCQDLPNGNYPDLEDCTKFYMCSHGLASSFSCPGSQLFDIKTLRCEWPGYATCVTSVKGKTRTDPPSSSKKKSGSDKCSRWTDWFNRDTPTRTGDWEDLIGLRRDYPGQICEKPTDIQARVVGSGLDASLTGDIYHFYDTTKGFVCRMGDQEDGTCQDYEVRFCCPNVDKCTSWTDWFNRDTPTRTGDWEDLIGLRRDYPGHICEKPTDIQARVVGSGLDASLTGDMFHFYDTTKGFVCRMGDQDDGTCQDYEVRFCCPNVV